MSLVERIFNSSRILVLGACMAVSSIGCQSKEAAEHERKYLAALGQAADTNQDGHVSHIEAVGCRARAVHTVLRGKTQFDILNSLEPILTTSYDSEGKIISEYAIEKAVIEYAGKK